MSTMLVTLTAATMTVCLMLLVQGNFGKEAKVFESTSPLDDTVSQSGFWPKSERKVRLWTLPGVSICSRFNYKRLMRWQSQLMQIGPWPDWWMMFLFIGYRATFVGFGNVGKLFWIMSFSEIDIDVMDCNHIDSFGGIPSWVIMEKNTEEFMLWSANRWHHICLSYKASTSRIMVVKVGIYMLFDVLIKSLNIKHAFVIDKWRS